MITRDQEQQLAIDYAFLELLKHKIALIEAPTGYGKSILIKKIIEQLPDYVTILVVAPRVNLVRDLSQKVDGSTIFCASLKEKKISRVTIATKQSLTKIKADYLLLDEAHNYTESFLESIKDDFRNIIGFSATPFREDGFIYGEDKFWRDPCYTYSIKDAINAGYLCGYEAFNTDKGYTVKKSKAKRDFTQKEIDEIINNQSDKLDGILDEMLAIFNKREIKKAAIFTASISQGEDVSNALIAKGEPNTLIHSKITDANDVVEDWKKNDVRTSVSVLMVTEGFDLTSLECIVLLRPMRSTRLMIQSVGRVLRLHPGKENALVLDYSGVFDNCGTPINPKFNFKGSNSSNSEDEERMRKCKACFFVYDSNSSVCPSCGFDNAPKTNYDKLKSSLFGKDNSVFFIFNKTHIDYRGKTRTGKDMITLKHKVFTVTLFAGQCRWFENMSKNGSWIKVYLKRSGKYLNMVNMEFAGSSTVDKLLSLDDLELLNLSLEVNE